MPHLARPIAVVVMIETIFLLSVFAEIFTTTNGGPGYASTNLAYLIYNQALVQFDVGMASAGGDCRGHRQYRGDHPGADDRQKPD